MFLSFSVAFVVSLSFKYLGQVGGFAVCFVFFGLFLAVNITMTLRKIDNVGNNMVQSFGSVMRNHQAVIFRQRQELDYMREKIEEFIDEEDWKSGGIYGDEEDDETEGVEE